MNKNNGEAKNFEVKGASIKDDLCNYSIHVARGSGIGKHNVKGELVVDEDLKIALSRFNVHLAIIDGVYKHKGIEIDKVSKFHTHEVTQDYSVSGFKMDGEEDNLSIVLTGTKNVSHGTMDIVTPKIILDNMGGYPFFKDLKAASEKAIQEVELYIEGKGTPQNPVEEEDPAQTTITDAIEEAEQEQEKKGRGKKKGEEVPA